MIDANNYVIEVDRDYYKEHYLMGKSEVIPLTEFAYWANKATRLINTYLWGKGSLQINDAMENIKQCVCELAEYLFRTEDSIGMTSQAVKGWSASYEKNGEKDIIKKHLTPTGLLYRGIR